MSEAPNDSGNSPVRVQEAESTQDSPEIDCPQSPDSTTREDGSRVQSSTANRSISSTNENINRAEGFRNVGFIRGNLASSDNLMNQGEQSSASTCSTDEMELGGSKSKLFDLLTRNSATDSDLIKKTEQKSTSGHIAQPSTSGRSTSSLRRSGDNFGRNQNLTTNLTVSQAANENLTVKRRQSRDSRPIVPSSASTARSASSDSQTVDNPLLTNMINVNPAASENLINQRHQSYAFGRVAQSSISAAKPTSSPGQPRHVEKQGERISVSRLPQPSTSINTSSFPQPGNTGERNQLLKNMAMFNPVVNKNLISRSSESRPITQSSSSTASPKFCPAQTHQVVKKEEQTPALSRRSFSSESAAPNPGEMEQNNPLLPSMRTGNPASNDQRQQSSGTIAQSSVSTPKSTSSPAKSGQKNKQGKESSASRQMAYPSFSTARTAPSPRQRVQNNPLLTNMTTDNPTANENLNNQRQNSASGRIAPSSALTAKPTSSPAQTREVNKQGEQSSASSLPQPNISTERSTSNPPQPSSSVKGDPLLRNLLKINPDVNENLINQRQNFASRQIAQSISSTASPRSRHETRQVVEREESFASRQAAQPRFSTASSASSTGQVVKDNPMLTNMIKVNSATNKNLSNQRQQSSASGPIAQPNISTEKPTSNPAQTGQENKQAVHGSPSRHQYPSIPIQSSAPSPQQPGSTVGGNPLLRNMLKVNPAANENLLNQRQQSSTSGAIAKSSISTPKHTCSPIQPRQGNKTGVQSSVSRLPQPSTSAARSASNPPQLSTSIKDNPFLTSMFMDNAAAGENLSNQGEQSSASRTCAQDRIYRKRTSSRPAQPLQITKLGEQSSVSRLPQPSTSTERSASRPPQLSTNIEDNPLLTSMFMDNAAAGTNLSNQGEQSSTSRTYAQDRIYRERTSSRPAQPLQITKLGEQSSVSRLPQPSTSTERSASRPPQLSNNIDDNPLLTSMFMVNPAVNENLINTGRQSSGSRQIAQSKASTARRATGPSQSRKVVKQEESIYASELKAQPNPSESASSPGKSINENTLLTNVITDSEAANENLLNQGEQSSATESMIQLRAQSARRTSGSAQSSQVVEQNQMLTNMVRHATMNEHMENRDESSSSSGQIAPGSPSRRKREGQVPDTKPSCSPTKKQK